MNPVPDVNQRSPTLTCLTGGSLREQDPLLIALHAADPIEPSPLSLYSIGFKTPFLIKAYLERSRIREVGCDNALVKPLGPVFELWIVRIGLGILKIRACRLPNRRFPMSGHGLSKKQGLLIFEPQGLISKPKMGVSSGYRSPHF